MNDAVSQPPLRPGRQLEGVRCVVTGGASGIGAAIVGRFVAEGAHVVIADIDEAAAVALAQRYDTAVAVRCDVTDRAAVDTAVDTAIHTFGGLEVMFNNAGTAGYTPLLEITPLRFHQMMDLNVLGMIHGTQAATGHMLRSGRGKIINTSSIVSKTAAAGTALYAATKFAVRGLTEGFAKELAPHGITVNSLCPGHIDTPLWDDADREYAQRGLATEGTRVVELMRDRIPLGRIGVPDDVSGLAVFLASSDSDYMTGQSINVDGGVTSI